MPIQTKFILVASMDISPDKESLLDEIYDSEHIPNLASVPGVQSVARFKRRDSLEILLGGELRTIRADNEPTNTVLYEIDDPQVLLTAEWAKKVEAGRWPTLVRPFTKNRRHLLLERCRPI